MYFSNSGIPNASPTALKCTISVWADSSAASNIAKNIILDYLKGKRADISPLNEDILLVMKEAEQGKGNIGFNSWLQTAITKCLM